MATKTPRRYRRFFIPWAAIFQAIFAAAAIGAIALAVLIAAVWRWPEIFFWTAEHVPRKEQKLTDDQEFFKYGSIGNEAREGIPFKLWKVLPSVCSKLIAPEGYRSFGFVFEEGKETPIGFSRVDLGGIEQMAINCSVCHVERYKETAEAAPKIFVGGAANTLDSQRYLRFLFGCAMTDGFETETLIAAIKAEFPKTSWAERQMFRVLLPIVRNALFEQAKRYAWTWSRPLWGPGRVDPFNPVKFSYLKQPVDDTIGNSDMMPAWNAELKEGIVRNRDPQELINWHWDGLSTDLKEVIINSALGDGMIKSGYRPETIERLLGYLHGLESPPSPLAVDPILKAQGEALFKSNCASCHGPDGSQVMKLVPIAQIGTDDHRMKMWTREATDAYNDYDKDHKPPFPWTLDQFRKNEAYISEPLNGIWLTGPYLHNGSVPSLDDLLKPVAERPKAYLRGLETLDLVKGGFTAPPCTPETYPGPGFCYDTNLPGNSNQGHEYGTGLSEAERHALVHYLLTL
jgi:Cytochrome C oxidase, cbb3-type, subunit III